MALESAGRRWPRRRGSIVPAYTFLSQPPLCVPAPRWPFRSSPTLEPQEPDTLIKPGRDGSGHHASHQRAVYAPLPHYPGLARPTWTRSWRIALVARHARDRGRLPGAARSDVTRAACVRGTRNALGPFSLNNLKKPLRRRGGTVPSPTTTRFSARATWSCATSATNWRRNTPCRQKYNASILGLHVPQQRTCPPPWPAAKLKLPWRTQCSTRNSQRRSISSGELAKYSRRDPPRVPAGSAGHALTGLCGGALMPRLPAWTLTAAGFALPSRKGPLQRRGSWSAPVAKHAGGAPARFPEQDRHRRR